MPKLNLPSNPLQKTLAFLNDIGLTCHLKPGATGFLDGLCIQNGELQVDPSCRVSNVLHEAGHLAILPGRIRHFANNDLTAMDSIITKYIDFSNPDLPEVRAVLQSGDTEATAWAFAAGLAIGLKPRTIIPDGDYEQNGLSVRIMLQQKRYLGINGLAAAGFCVTRPASKKHFGLPTYPNLAKWLQPTLGTT